MIKYQVSGELGFIQRVEIEQNEIYANIVTPKTKKKKQNIVEILGQDIVLDTCQEDSCFYRIKIEGL